jgi:hypothetical protein
MLLNDVTGFLKAVEGSVYSLHRIPQAPAYLVRLGVGWSGLRVQVPSKSESSGPAAAEISLNLTRDKTSLSSVGSLAGFNEIQH